MARHLEPNASHYSARYAEQRRAAERARDAASGPSPCNRCATKRAPGSIFCSQHAAEYEALRASGAAPKECFAFCERTLAMTLRDDGDLSYGIDSAPDDPHADECGRCSGTGEIGEGRFVQTCPVCRGSALSGPAEAKLAADWHDRRDRRAGRMTP